MLPFYRIPFLCLLVSLSSGIPLLAVETITGENSSYNTNNNIAASVTNWSNGWGTGNTNTGWNYVGMVNAGSGVYLGNGWVLTCNHVNAGTFTLNGNTYDYAGSQHNTLTNSSGQIADLNLFSIDTTSTTGTNLTLPPLTLMSVAPTLGNNIVMIGYGYTNGLGPESWGTNPVSITNNSTAYSTYTSTDFLSLKGGSLYSAVVDGDSGGAAFLTNALGTWQLAGINEGTNTSYSFFVQLSPYAAQINAITGVPEPSTWSLMALGILIIGFTLRRVRRGVS